jgi:hypothetical protein
MSDRATLPAEGAGGVVTVARVSLCMLKSTPGVSSKLTPKTSRKP